MPNKIYQSPTETLHPAERYFESKIENENKNLIKK